MRHKDQFQGARHELFAIATCIRAGYCIEFEDESDVTRKHVELTATHRVTRQRIVVEAKSRHRRGVLGYPGVRVPDEEVQIGIRGLMQNALVKPVTDPFVVFIDLNLPPNSPAPLTQEWLDRIGGPILTEFGDEEGGDPWNLVVFSNIPNHYTDDSLPAPSGNVVGLFGRNPKLVVESPESLHAILDAALKFDNLPNSFDELQ